MAAHYLGVWYLRGTGVGKDLDKAKALLLKAYTLNCNSTNMHNMGVICKKRAEYSEAVKWYTLAANHGTRNSISSLRAMLRDGQCERSNVDKAMESFAQALPADRQSACIYEAALRFETKKLYKEAAHLYARAVDLGDVNAMNKLAAMHQQGQGVDKDTYQAKVLYVRALSLCKDPLTMHNLASICNLRKEDAEAMQFYFNALEAGHKDAANGMFSLLASHIRDEIQLTKDDDAISIIKWLLALHVEGLQSKMSQAVRAMLAIYDHMEVSLAPGGRGYLEAKTHFLAMSAHQRETTHVNI